MASIAVPPPISQHSLGVFYRKPLLSGEQGTSQTIQVMRALVDDASGDAAFVRQAIDIVRGVAAYDEMGEAQALFQWVQRNIRFTKDPLTKEKLYPPQELLKIRAGDCDDIAMLLGALLMALGYPARLVTVSANPGQPEEFSHVYLEGEIPPGSGQWVAMDAARWDSQFGVEPPAYFRKRAWSLTDDSYQDLAGLGNYLGLVEERLAGLGYGDSSGDGIDWSQLTSQLVSETPALISAATGKPSTTTGPYGSFTTGATPGYAVPAAGYSLQTASTSLFSGALPWIAIGLVAVALFSRGGR